MSAAPAGRAATRDAEQLVEAAARAHKLGRSRREWALDFATRDPALFAEIMEHTPDYERNRLDASTNIFIERLRIEADRRDGRDTGPSVLRLILRMRRLAHQLGRDIEDELIPPGWASERDRLLAEAKRLTKPLKTVRVNPLARGKGGRPKFTRDASRGELLRRFIAWRRTREPGERLTQKALAAMAPSRHPDSVADHLKRAGWKLLDVEANGGAASAGALAANVEKTG